ncbi:NACHT domain-containing protein [Actinomadura nitritigenes]|uniref:NACHT domain-containing protein n=1 Tax=Actinomadura nitritigenes TaxID=134602 RepID=UPI003D89B21C
MNRSLWLLAVTGGALIVASTAYLLTSGFSLGNADKVSSAMGAAAGVVSLAVTLASLKLSRRGRRDPAEALDMLASLVREQWASELARSRQDVREPLAVPLLVHGSHEETLREAAPAALGDLSDIGQIFQRRVPPRFVITGPAGSGKTTAAALLLLDLLERRERSGPVPVLVSMAAWDPARRPFEDWLAEQISRTYALSPEAARELVGRRKVIPILDGFDELPAQKAGQALRRMNAGLHGDDPLVITAREDALDRAARSRQGEVLQHATVLRLEPVGSAQLVRYLEGVLPQEHYPGWDRWRERLLGEPGGALERALSLPGNVDLVRRAYLDARRPLPDLGSLTEQEIIERLLSDWIDRLYPRSGRGRSWLSTVAREWQGGFVWWRLYQLVPRWALVVSVGVLHLFFYGVSLAACFGTKAATGDLVSGVASLEWLALLVAAGFWDEFADVRGAAPETTEPLAQLRREVRVRGAAAIVLGVAVGLGTGLWGPDAGVRGGVFLGVVTAFFVMLASSVGIYAVSVVILAGGADVPWWPLAVLERARRLDVMRAVGGAYWFRRRQVQDLFAATAPEQRRDAGFEGPPDETTAPSDGSARAGATATRPEGPASAAREHPGVPPGQSGPATGMPDRPVPDSTQQPSAGPAQEAPRVGERPGRRADETGTPPVPPPPPDGDRPVSRRERLDVFAREAVLREVLVLPEMLRRVDQRDPVASRARLRTLAASLLDHDPLAVEAPARDRGQRFDEALDAFEKAAALPFLSRFVTAYIITAGAAGTALAGLFVAQQWWPWAPDATFAASVVLLLSVFLWLSFRRNAAQRRALRSRDPAEWLQLDELPHLRLVLDRTYRDWIRAMARDGLLPMLTDRLGEEPPAYTTELHGLELEPLSGTDDRDDHFVETDASRRVSLLIEELSSASIGLSGARGAGKSTVLRHLCDPERHPDNDLRLLVHAPTAYDSREFLTHLFIRVCERVVGSQGPRPAPARRLRMLTMRVLPWACAGAGLVLIVGTLYRGRIRALADRLPDGARPYVLAGGGLLILAGLAVALLVNRRPRLRSMTRAQVVAHDHLRRLRYQQAVTRTAVGEAAIPGGGKIGGQLAVQQTEQAQSLPGLVAGFQELLTMVGTERRAGRNKVVIGVDELDKIATAGEAEQFLNDLKVIFGVPGCYFLVTVSEDALAAFGRRSLSVRDTFDSAFDTVVEIPPLRGREALDLLSRRGVPLPVPYVWICHVMTAGLARDLVRSVRGLAAVSAEWREEPSPDGRTGASRQELEHLARRMIAEDVAAVMEAQLRGAAADAEGTVALLEWLAACADLPITAADIETGIAAMPAGELSFAARTFAVQTRTYLAITAILVRLFVEHPKKTAEWLRDLAEQPRDRHPLDRLAEIRGLLANHPHLAWHAVLRLRREVAWPVPQPPLDLAPAPPPE